MSLLSRMSSVVRESGVIGLVRRGVAAAYRRGIRRHLPVLAPVRYAGLPVATGDGRRLGDRTVPAAWSRDWTPDIPDYEASLITGLGRHVRAGDRVVVVGGGVGVTSAYAALRCGASGRVVCYEGSADGVEVTRRTAALNGVSDRLEVRHAVVARAIGVYGSSAYGAVVPPAALEPCDVLELDCEGAEVDVLREMGIRPRVILVETHGLYGATTDLVTSVLREIGYHTTLLGVAEPRLREDCTQYDIHVVEAVRGASPPATHDRPGPHTADQGGGQSRLAR